jgi:hypothetical protein
MVPLPIRGAIQSVGPSIHWARVDSGEESLRVWKDLTFNLGPRPCRWRHQHPGDATAFGEHRLRQQRGARTVPGVGGGGHDERCQRHFQGRELRRQQGPGRASVVMLSLAKVTAGIFP